MKLTKQNIEDLQWVLDFANSPECLKSEYYEVYKKDNCKWLDSKHYKVCKRVQKLIDQLKEEYENTKKHTQSFASIQTNHKKA